MGGARKRGRLRKAWTDVDCAPDLKLHSLRVYGRERKKITQNSYQPIYLNISMNERANDTNTCAATECSVTSSKKVVFCGEECT